MGTDNGVIVMCVFVRRTRVNSPIAFVLTATATIAAHLGREIDDDLCVFT